MKKNAQDVSNQDILEKLDSFSANTNKEIHGLKQEFGSLKQEFGSLKQEVGSIKQLIEASNQEILETMAAYATHTDSEISGLKSDMRYVKGVINTQMPTKDYIDNKLFKLSGEIGGSVRKEDEKVDTLTGILTEKKILTKQEAKRIAQMGPSFMKV